MSGAKNLFITGRPGIGKTTAVLKTLALLSGRACGFHTREIRQGNRRVGFEIADLEGRCALMAHVDLPKAVRVSRYGVDVSAVEAIGASALQRALRERALAVIDEVGSMELASPRFVEALLAVLDADIPVLGTVHLKGDPVTAAIKRRDDTEVWRVTAQNRDEMPARLAHALKQWLY